MCVIGRTDVDQIDVVALDQLAPVGFIRLISPVVGEGFDVLLVSSTACLEHGAILEIEKSCSLCGRRSNGPGP